MSQNTIAIEQINLGYQQAEDRLLLKVGMTDQTEIALWVTRRICKELWHLLQDSHGQIVEAPIKAKRTTAKKLPAPKLVKRDAEKSIETSHLESEGFDVARTRESLEVMDFSTDYNADRESVSEVPILIVACTLSVSDENITRLDFKALSGEVIKMGLTIELVVAMMNMMQMATREASWDLLMLQSNVSKHLQPSEQVLH